MVTTTGNFAKVTLVLYGPTGIKTGHLIASSPGKITEHFPNETRSLCPKWDPITLCPRGSSKTWHGEGEQRVKMKESGLGSGRMKETVHTQTEELISIGHCGY